MMKVPPNALRIAGWTCSESDDSMYFPSGASRTSR